MRILILLVAFYFSSCTFLDKKRRDNEQGKITLDFNLFPEEMLKLELTKNNCQFLAVGMRVPIVGGHILSPFKHNEIQYVLGTGDHFATPYLLRQSIILKDYASKYNSLLLDVPQCAWRDSSLIFSTPKK